MRLLCYRLLCTLIRVLVKEMVASPDLPQPRVNKCLIALVTKKIVSKNSIGVSNHCLMS